MLVKQQPITEGGKVLHNTYCMHCTALVQYKDL